MLESNVLACETEELEGGLLQSPVSTGLNHGTGSPDTYTGSYLPYEGILNFIS